MVFYILAPAKNPGGVVMGSCFVMFSHNRARWQYTADTARMKVARPTVPVRHAGVNPRQVW